MISRPACVVVVLAKEILKEGRQPILSGTVQTKKEATMVTRLKRSCLVMVSWFFVGLAVIFFVGNGYVMLRMTLAQFNLNRVSAQLGYTSDSLVTEGLTFGEGNPFTVSHEYRVVRYFTTPLNASALQTRLQETRLNPRKQKIDESALLLSYNALVDGIPAQVLKAQGLLPSIPRYCWELNIARLVCFNEISMLEKSIELRGKVFSDNVIGLSVSGVRVQLWMLPGLTLWARLQGYRY